MPSFQGTFMVKLSILAACAIAISAPAVAGDGATPVAPTAAEPVKEKMVCQRIEETGTRGSKKVCQTESQWRAQQQQDKRNVTDRDRNDR
jgi:hypothetical protein